MEIVTYGRIPYPGREGGIGEGRLPGAQRAPFSCPCSHSDGVLDAHLLPLLTCPISVKGTTIQEVLCPSLPLSPYRTQEVTGSGYLSLKHMLSLPTSNSTAPTHVSPRWCSGRLTSHPAFSPLSDRLFSICNQRDFSKIVTEILSLSSPLLHGLPSY